MTNKKIIVRAMAPERLAQLLSAPKPVAESPTQYAAKTDSEILKLDLDASLSKEQAFAVQAEMSKRNLYGN